MKKELQSKPWVSDFCEKRSKRLFPLHVLCCLLFFFVLIVFTCLFINKPLLEHTSYLNHQTMGVLQAYNQAIEPGSQGRVEMEEFTHQDNNTAYILLESLYTRDAIKQSGIDMKDSNVDLTKVDTSKRDGLLRQALSEASDYTLMMVLTSNREKWDDEYASKISALISGESQAVQNSIKLRSISEFSPEQKEEFSKCYRKLAERNSNDFWKIVNFRSVGTCSKYQAKEATLEVMFKLIFHVSSISDEMS